MIRTLGILGLSVATLALVGCCGSPCCDTGRVVARGGGGTAIDVGMAQDAVKLELTLDEAGRTDEIEYHVDPAAVPEAVRRAMDAIAPGPDAGAEMERNEGKLYYELTRVVDGKEIEAMFHPDGRLHEIEAQVDASTVPSDAKGAVTSAWPNGSSHSWEVIKDEDQQVVEYHVKFRDGARNLKVAVSTGGTILGAFREIVSEIEVPVPVR